MSDEDDWDHYIYARPSLRKSPESILCSSNLRGHNLCNNSPITNKDHGCPFPWFNACFDNSDEEEAGDERPRVSLSKYFSKRAKEPVTDDITLSANVIGTRCDKKGGMCKDHFCEMQFSGPKELPTVTAYKAFPQEDQFRMRDTQNSRFVRPIEMVVSEKFDKDSDECSNLASRILKRSQLSRALSQLSQTALAPRPSRKQSKRTFFANQSDRPRYSTAVPKQPSRYSTTVANQQAERPRYSVSAYQQPDRPHYSKSMKSVRGGGGMGYEHQKKTYDSPCGQCNGYCDQGCQCDACGRKSWFSRFSFSKMFCRKDSMIKKSLDKILKKETQIVKLKNEIKKHKSQVQELEESNSE